MDVPVLYIICNKICFNQQNSISHESDPENKHRSRCNLDTGTCNTRLKYLNLFLNRLFVCAHTYLHYTCVFMLHTHTHTLYI